MPHKRNVRILCTIAGAIAAASLLLSACDTPSVEDRARAAAADIQASIQDYDGPALQQEVEEAVVREIQENLSKLKEYMDEVDGEIDPVLINAIQAFQREQNEAIPWWQFWARRPNDGLITPELREAISAAAAA